VMGDMNDSSKCYDCPAGSDKAAYGNGFALGQMLALIMTGGNHA